jgi:hypothetical protein
MTHPDVDGNGHQQKLRSGKPVPDGSGCFVLAATLLMPVFE